MARNGVGPLPMESQNSDCEQPPRLIAAKAAATPTPQAFIGQGYADADTPDCCRSEGPIAIRFRKMLETGTPAPDFELANQDGELVSLSALRGRNVVLYFYPKADTPGCTEQACGVRDRGRDYAAADAVVLGVSPDSVAKLKRFAEKYGLPFTLLADVDHAVAERYGVWVQKSMYGRTYWGNSRTTFIIDRDGVVRHVIPKVKPKTHDDEVLAALAEI